MVVFVPSLLITVEGAGRAVGSFASLSDTSSAHSRLESQVKSVFVCEKLGFGAGTYPAVFDILLVS